MSTYKPHYSEKNPKIDVYFDGVYAGSTNWYPTIKQYMASGAYKSALIPYTGQVVKCRIDK
jgi:hypothetical protein